MKSPEVTCGHCHGRGKLRLTGAALETLSQLRKCHDPISGASLAKRMGVSNEAMCNRLRSLERHGLIVGERYGRTVLWKLS